MDGAGESGGGKMETTVLEQQLKKNKQTCPLKLKGEWMQISLGMGN